MEKDAIKVEGYVRTGKNFGRTYTYNLTEQEYQANMFKNGVVYNSDKQAAIIEFITTVLKGEKLDAQTAEQLKLAIDAQVAQ